MFTVDNTEFKISIEAEESLRSLVRATQEMWGHTNETQAILCILEAIKSGDFMQYISSDKGLLSDFTYKPYRLREELEKENAELRLKIKRYEMLLEEIQYESKKHQDEINQIHDEINKVHQEGENRRKKWAEHKI